MSEVQYYFEANQYPWVFTKDTNSDFLKTNISYKID